MRKLVLTFVAVVMSLVVNAQIDILISNRGSIDTIVYAQFVYGSTSGIQYTVEVKNTQNVVFEAGSQHFKGFKFWSKANFDINPIYQNANYISGVVQGNNAYGNVVKDSILTSTFIAGEQYVLGLVDGSGSTYFILVKIVDQYSSTAGIEEASAEQLNVSIYPNPVVDFVTVDFESKSIESVVEVYNMGGQMVYSDNETRMIGSNQIKIDMSDFQSGMYIVRVGNSTYKVIK